MEWKVLRGMSVNILYSMIVVLVLSACVTSVSFRNVNIGVKDNLPTEVVRGLLATPSGKGPFPAVVLLHTCGGVGTHISEDWPAFLTSNGYVALTVDTFGSRNAGRCPAARRLGGTTMWRDAYGALDYLASRSDIDPVRIGVMGFSLGARAVEGFSAHDIKSPSGRNFKAGIAVYGSCGVSGKRSFPVLAIIGDRDSNSGYCPKETGRYSSVEIIPNAYHAFDNRDLTTVRPVAGNFGKYDWAATNIAHELTRKFLAKHLAE